jgi:nitroreductase
MTTPNIAKADIIEGFKYRHATKEFDPTKIISNDDVYSRNSSFITKFFGFEPWHFIVVQDKKLRELLKPVAWEHRLN